MVSPMGAGYADTPGIWSARTGGGWQLDTRAVHDAGGRIFLQLWHVGRISDPIFLNGRCRWRQRHPGQRQCELAASADAVSDSACARTEEIPAIIAAFRKGAENAHRRIRRRGNARRERLPAGPVFAGLQRMTHRRIWRFARK